MQLDAVLIALNRPEAYDEADKDRYTGKSLYVGKQLDDAGASKHNGGFFVDGILKSLEHPDGPPEVKASFSIFGHETIAQSGYRSSQTVIGTTVMLVGG